MKRWVQVDPLMQDQGDKVLSCLLSHGFAAYYVGGCVRDELMHRPVHDMDIATSAKPEDVISMFDRTVPTGLQHGTVTVLMDSYSFEVTTFRKESEYLDHRHPSQVEFVDEIIWDLQRRDFTMNAMARDLEGLIRDPFHGQRDIEQGVIRCVGKAEERFEEDALRMMRAIRFASVFGFRPVKSLWKALISGRDKLSYIAMERNRAEIERIVLGPDPLRGLAYLERSGVLAYLKYPFHLSAGTSKQPAEVWAVLAKLPADQPSLRWSILLQLIGLTGDTTEDFMKRWTFPNRISTETASLLRFEERWKSAVQQYGDQENKLRKEWIKLQVRLGKATAASWLQREHILGEAMRGSWNPLKFENHSKLLQLTFKWHAEVKVHSLKELAVTGGDILTRLDRRGGPWLAELLHDLLIQVAAGELPNDGDILLEHVKAVVNCNG